MNVHLRGDRGQLRLRSTLLAILLAAGVSGCLQDADQNGSQATLEQGLTTPAGPTLRAPSLAVATGPVCQGTGAHDAHAILALGCAACHPCGGQLGLTPGLTLPSGRAIDGTITPNGASTSCSVACHQPIGQPTATITWNTVGPLACSGCHEQGLPPPGGGSFHPRDNSSAAANRNACQLCHDLSNHVSGVIRIQTPTGVIAFPRRSGGSTAANPACEACHLGGGPELAGLSPPLLVGWTDTVAGDFHGSRVGTGSGGTLAPPYTRGQGPLACSACHEPHSSGNAFLLAAKVNGVNVPAGTISRSGVGAERLCTACHQGERHAFCMTCHGVDPQPAGSACFVCHGHEGIRYIPLPVGTHPHLGGQGTGLNCAHCHSGGWAPAPETVPPAISSITVANVTGTSATVSWSTNESASSFVEYGTSSIGQVAGTGGLSSSHVVTLTGLTGPATYQFRVRSADAYRNVSVSALSTFVTSDPRAPAAPTGLVPFGDYTGDATYPVPLTWSAVTAPQGNPVQYQVEIWNFYGPVADSGWITGNSWIAMVPTQSWPLEYAWHVRARDATFGVNSSWSAPSSIYLWWYEY
jgi:Doubled CXXCH motif (Paired_CXXCH_1)